MAKFSGFARPKSNFYRLPNDWFDVWRYAREELAQGAQPARIVGSLKIVEYVIKYTWGRTNFDEPVRLSRSDLRKGVRGRYNRRLDKGTGLGSEATISRGISTALALGLLEQVEVNDDPGRQERLYLPRLRPPEKEAELSPSPQMAGFERPIANFFLVPNYWSDISADIRSEILIIAMEYFFRHAWGWQTGAHEIRWLDADDVANGRKYRSVARRGNRYDKGTGYTTRKVRDALEDGVKRDLLVWRHGQTGKEYALRMAWMEAIGEDGYFDNETDWTEASSMGDQTVEVNDQTVGVSDQSVGMRDRTVEGQDQNVGENDQSVEVRDQTVDRTYKDTIRDTKYKTSLTNTRKTSATRYHKHGDVAGNRSKSEKSIIFFCPELESGELGLPKKLTIDQAAKLIHTQNGAWYWSEADLADPERANQAGFTISELTAQIELDNYLLGDDCAFLDNGKRWDILSLLEIARRMISSETHYQPLSVCYGLWQLLDLPEPEGVMGDGPAKRRELLHQLQQQAEAWGDPDLITALERINISVDEARLLVTHYGVGLVGGWLRSLHTNSRGVRSLAAVLISRLNKGLSPPGGEMEAVVNYKS